MGYRETPLLFECRGESLVGVLTCPDGFARVAVIIVVGGPQYRVGSHRQFVLLARALGASGIACLRFDCRGMGDSEGDPVKFTETGPDIVAAVGAIERALPGLESIVLLGLCDGASASAFASAHPRIGGLVLLNPWVRTEGTEAGTVLKHYYASRLRERNFWRKLVSGNLRVGPAAKAFLTTALAWRRERREPQGGAEQGLARRLGGAMLLHRGPQLVILSGRDQTANEFRAAAEKEAPLGEAMTRPALTCVEVPDADHTFSTARWRDHVAAITIGWLVDHFQVAQRPAIEELRQ